MPRKNPAAALAEMAADLRDASASALESGDAVTAIRSAVSADALECAALSRAAYGVGVQKDAARPVSLFDIVEELDREERLCRFRSR